ncbi:unnamed protein product [Cochlearia groenlandica]
MKVESFIPAVIIFLCFCALFCSGTSRSLQTHNKGNKDHKPTSYISWEDMRVMKDVGTERRFRTKRVIVVDKSGRGDSVTVQGAVNLVPRSNSQRVKIFILPGIYREKVYVPSTKPYISFIGNESYAAETVITWNDKASDRLIDGSELGTYRTATVSIDADFFCATAITFENTVVAKAGVEGKQAAALRITGDKAMFYRVRVLGSQDTLNDETGSHYFYQCYIQGNIDFIFGNAKSLYQSCHISSTAKRFGAIAAHHRALENEDTGYSFANCYIGGTGKVYLGRAWGNYSRIVYSNCFIDDIITPLGWNDWDDADRQRKVMFGEYNCWGRGAERRGRVPWSKNLTQDEVKPFLGREFIYGDQWLRL